MEIFWYIVLMTMLTIYVILDGYDFGAGIIPLVFAVGAGAASRQEIGVSVLGGVVFGTVLVLIFIPFMYVLIRSIFKVTPKLEHSS